jgi:hypothetical protein
MSLIAIASFLLIISCHPPFYLVMVSIEAFQVKGTHRSVQSSASQLVRCRVEPYGKPLASSSQLRFHEPDATPLKGLKAVFN